MACPYTTADPKGSRSLEWTDKMIEKYAHLTTRLSMACPYTTADPKGKRSLEWTDEMIDDYEHIKLRIAMNEGLAYKARSPI